MNREQRLKVIEQWMQGKLAPYDLFEGRHPETGNPILVEAASTPAILRRGDVIPADIAERIKLQLDPPAQEPVLTHVAARDANGQLQFTAEGDLVTEEVEVMPEALVCDLSPVTPELAYDDDMHCDMCGEWREKLNQIGTGWYCRVERLSASKQTVTCFNERLKQMGVL